MRALRIDPWKREITELDLDDDGDGCITYEALRAAVFPEPLREGLIQSVGLGTKITGYVDEEGMLVDWDHQRFFALHPPGEPQQSNDYAGFMVLTGDDGWGGACALPAHITPAMMRLRLKWLDAREVACPALKIYTEDPETGEIELVEDQGTWTYNNQP